MILSFLLSISSQAEGERADLSFLAYIDVWIISGLVLLAVVVVAGKWLWNMLRRKPEDPYEYYYDEDYGPDDDDYIERR